MSDLELATDDELASIPPIGSVLDGKFRIDGLLGKGGMGVVLAATHLQLERRVAIKLLFPAYASDPEAASRFLQEGRSASKIRSEHVVRIIDVGADEARPYLVMEYLDGTDLDALVARDGPLPSVLAVDYLLQACEAIAEAHVIGMVHRDLKPANLFLTHGADGAASVKVLDFGISKILRSRNSAVLAHETSPLLLMGSPHYMSPEQMKSTKNVDQRSDLWSLGAILHELVVGTPPFQASTITALCAAIMTEAPPPLASPRGELTQGELGAVVRRCLQKEPADRFANVADLAAALAPLGSDAARESAERIARVLDGATNAGRGEQAMVHPTAPPTSDAITAGPHPRRASVARVAALVALLIACSGAAWGVVQYRQASRNPESSPSAMALLPSPAMPLPSSAASVSDAPSAAHRSAPPRHAPILSPAATLVPASIHPATTGTPDSAPAQAIAETSTARLVPPTWAVPSSSAAPILPGSSAAPSGIGVAEDGGGAENPY